MDGNRRIFSCRDCGKQFGRKYNRDRHINTCRAVSRDCEVCGETFVGDVSLLLHDCPGVCVLFRFHSMFHCCLVNIDLKMDSF